MSPNSAPGRRCASRLDHSRSVSIDRSPDVTPVATTQSPAVKCELSAAGNPKTDDRRRAGEHGSLDGVRLKSDISAAGEHAHARRRGDPGFCFQTRDNNQTSPLTRRPANDWLYALLRIRAGRRQAVCATIRVVRENANRSGPCGGRWRSRMMTNPCRSRRSTRRFAAIPPRNPGCVMDCTPS